MIAVGTEKLTILEKVNHATKSGEIQQIQYFIMEKILRPPSMSRSLRFCPTAFCGAEHVATRHFSHGEDKCCAQNSDARKVFITATDKHGAQTWQDCAEKKYHRSLEDQPDHQARRDFTDSVFSFSKRSTRPPSIESLQTQKKDYQCEKILKLFVKENITTVVDDCFLFPSKVSLLPTGRTDFQVIKTKTGLVNTVKG